MSHPSILEEFNADKMLKMAHAILDPKNKESQKIKDPYLACLGFLDIVIKAEKEDRSASDTNIGVLDAIEHEIDNYNKNRKGSTDLTNADRVFLNGKVTSINRIKNNIDKTIVVKEKPKKPFKNEKKEEHAHRSHHGNMVTDDKNKENEDPKHSDKHKKHGSHTDKAKKNPNSVHNLG